VISFESDYANGAHPKVLERLVQTNGAVQPGYGNDEYCCSAKEKIRAACGCPGGAVYFVSGGPQTNQLVISTVLMPYEGVIAPETGHVVRHERKAAGAGAVPVTMPGGNA